MKNSAMEKELDLSPVLMSMDEAIDEACGFTGIDRSRAEVMKFLVRDEEDGFIFEFALKEGDYRYSYTMDARNGMVMDYSNINMIRTR